MGAKGAKKWGPVSKLHPTSRRFFGVLDRIKSLHLKKAHDYGSDQDPLANIRQCQAFGLDPKLGVFYRLSDKFFRLAAFFRKGELKNEPVEDTLLDIASYAVIMFVLMEEDG